MTKWELRASCEGAETAEKENGGDYFQADRDPSSVEGT